MVAHQQQGIPCNYTLKCNQAAMKVRLQGRQHRVARPELALAFEVCLPVVNVDTMAQKKICHESFMFQNEDTSSMENNRPPTGAPNAEATPAAAPALIKLRLKYTHIHTSTTE